MKFMQVSELKRSKTLWETLESDHEIVLTKDGKPNALVIPVNSDDFETILNQTRRIRFGEILNTVRKRAQNNPIDIEEIEQEIEAVRSSRKI